MQRLHRRSIRLEGYDYTQGNAYFVTICTSNRTCIFGKVIEGKMHENEFGNIVREEWFKTQEIRGFIDLDYFIVMPNHIHGIMFFNISVGATRWVAQPRGPKPNSLGSIIGQYKSVTSKRINKLLNESRVWARHRLAPTIWQRNYFEHVIRNEKELEKIRYYIEINPLKWDLDRNNPLNF